MAEQLNRLKAALADRYAIDRELGRGGMATVYLAEDLKNKRQVAIKVLRPELAAALGPDRFLREIAITAKLNHPHILPLHDSGEADGQLFYVMPVVEGESLRDRLNREKQLPVEDALQIARDVASALDYAHGHDVIHRDIKPENVLLEAGGAVVTDFGIARAISEAGGDRLTETGIAVGTPAYMSPEQASGSSDLDQRSDEYSLACVIYEMLAGEPPFTGPSAESVVRQHLSREPPDITATRSGVPLTVAMALQRGLAKTPADRYADVQQLATALSAETHEPPGRRRRVVAIAAGATLAVFIALLLVINGRNSANAPSRDSPAKLLVLPFTLLGSDADAHVADGLTEEIRSRIGRLPSLLVLGRQTAQHVKDLGMTEREIGEQLDVAYILDGTLRIQRAADAPGQVRATPTLTRTADGAQLWSETLDRRLDDLFSLQASVAEHVVDALGLALNASQRAAMAGSATHSPEAYEHYLRGEAHLKASFPTQPGMWGAADEFQKAVEADPNFALAHARLAVTHATIYSQALDRSTTRLSLARMATERALALDPQSPEAHFALGIYHYVCCDDYDRARAEYGKALPERPNDYLLLIGLEAAEKRSGNLEIAAALAAQAADIEPFARVPHTEGYVVTELLRRYDEAERYLDRLALIRPQEILVYRNRAALHLLRDGDIGRARAALEEGARVTNTSYWALIADRAKYFLSMRVARVLCSVQDCASALNHLARGDEADLDAASEFYWANGVLRSWMGQSTRALAYYDSAAIVMERRAAKLPERVQEPVRLITAYSSMGDAVQTHNAVQQALSGPLAQKDWYVKHNLTLARSEALVLLGEFDVALEQLDSLLSVPSLISVPWVRVDPLWNPLRSDPRFQAILAKYEN